MKKHIVSILTISILLAMCPLLVSSQVSNKGTINQSGNTGSAYIEQSGSNNNAVINQSGSNDAAITVQEGKSNKAQQNQYGDNNNYKKDTNDPYLKHDRSPYYVYNQNVGVIIHQIGENNESVQNQWANDSLINNYVYNGNLNLVNQTQYADSTMMEMFTNIKNGDENIINQKQTGKNNLMQNNLISSSHNEITQIQINPELTQPAPSKDNRNSAFLYANNTNNSRAYQSQSNGLTSRAIIWQVGVEAADVYQDQDGPNNKVVAYQSNKGSLNRDNKITQNQDGEDNLLLTLQYGEYNSATAKQLSASVGNDIFQYQSGTHNTSSISQGGDSNTVTSLQYSDGVDPSVTTPGMGIFGGVPFSFPVVSLPTN